MGFLDFVAGDVDELHQDLELADHELELVVEGGD